MKLKEQQGGCRGLAAWKTWFINMADALDAR